MRNLTMLTDLYQLTMSYGYFKHHREDTIAVYDMFYRKTAGDSTYSIAAGLELLIETVKNFHFDEEDLAYLRSLGLFDDRFLDYLRELRFTGEIYAVPEGTVVFPNEPLVRVKAPIIEAQLIETVLLNIINHQTLIATKANSVVRAAAGDSVLEFGLRRAQGPDAGLYGARAAMIGGCNATSNVQAGQLFNVPVAGTHAHSWVMSFDSELEAFRAYADIFPDACLLLVDTYDTLGSGVPNAITVLNELKAKGHKPLGIRLDSGDLAYLSKRARAMLDEAGLTEAKICASSDLDEDLIRDLKLQGARIDTWGVGTKLITSYDCPALGGVYKLAAEERDGVMIPKIKLSDNSWKVTNPGYKKVVRIYGGSTGMAIADLIMLDDEVIDETKPLTIFDQIDVWKRLTISGFKTRELLVPIFVDGEQVYESPAVSEIQEYSRRDQATFWDEYRRLRRPQLYKVDLSDKLYALKKELRGLKV